MKKLLVVLIEFICIMLILCACYPDVGSIVSQPNGENHNPIIDSADEPSSELPDGVNIFEFTGLEPYYVAWDNTICTYGLYDRDKNEFVVEPCFSYIESYDSEGMALAQKDGYYGYIDQMGNTVIGFQFSDAQPFNELGVAIVRMNQVGVIDRIGNFVIDPMFQRITYRDNFIQVYDGRYFGLYDFEGNMIISPTCENEFLFVGDYIYTLKNDRWYEVFDHSGNSLLDSLKGVMKKDATLSSWIGENELVDGVTLPVHGLHICKYSDASTQFVYYRLFDSSLTLLKEQDYAYITPFNELGYAAAVPCEFKVTQYRYPTMDEEGDWVGINSIGEHFIDLPNITGAYHSDAYWGYRYLYINDYFGHVKWDGEALINISTEDVSRWKTVESFDGTNYIIAQNDNTDLWTLFDGDVIVDNTCTEIVYNDGIFFLTHGGETSTYVPADRAALHK